ncbi:MAG TPA: Gfo/Idh/MocA family oxidoreductase [Acidobacteriota bacterium]|nr:Gfo/Idh/MocA family oxidoreductase [Acidobacteriota bacterium]
MKDNVSEKKGQGMTRRDFAKASAAAGAGIALSTPRAFGIMQERSRKRYAIVGVGSRSRMYQQAVHETFAQYAELVAVCDTNAGRLKLAQQIARRSGRPEPAAYDARDFDKMIADTKPDTVIVTTVDGFHHQYIVRAMELGCDAMTEKPMTTNVEKCRQIIEAQKRTGKKCTVTFNYRYSPPRTQVKDLLMAGTIGEVLSVDFHWMLNTIHGADYFRRWHSSKEMSGGLMIHKASHHWDLVNWWLSDIPVAVQANGKREFYTPQMARRLGLQSHHERCHTCPEKDKCGFLMDLAASPQLKELYLDNEQYDGYYRDKCVFRPEIDIEDTMNVLVTYAGGPTLCYSLNAFNSWEGYTVVFNGTKGRLEHKMEEQVYVFGDAAVPGAIKPEGTYIRIYPLRDPAYEVDVWTGEGGHGGGDRVMLNDLFNPEREPDKYLRAADHRAGAYSMLVGAAANQCFITGGTVKISDLIPGIPAPEYPPMPGEADPVPMPKKIQPRRG